MDINENDSPKKLGIFFNLVRRMFCKVGLKNVIIKMTLDLGDALKNGTYFVLMQ